MAMTNNELVQKILAEVEAYQVPLAPAGNQMFEAMYNAQELAKKRIADIVRSYLSDDLRETDPDKWREKQLRQDGWLKLLPNEKVETSQPNRFRYIAPDYSSGVVIIENGNTYGVYASPGSPEGWRDRYYEVPWDTHSTES